MITERKVRNSNLELFRIVTMVLIVAHHYVVNSGLTGIDGPIYSNPFSVRSIYLLLFGAWGKTGINCFMLITGYFMSTSQITLKKYLKLLFQILFYKILITIFFAIIGYEPITISNLINMFIPITSIGTDFTSAFLVFYLFIPFINKLTINLTEIQHLKLVLLFLFTYTFLGSIPFFDVTMNYVSWFTVLYFVASYIRLYPKKIFSNIIIWKRMLFISVILSATSVVLSAWLSQKIGRNIAYYFVTDSNTFLAFLTGLSAFMFFLNLKIKNSKFINTVAASTFGVLLIHAHSDTMRQWLWSDTLNNTGMYYSDWVYIHAIVSVLAVFAICTLIDYLRIRTIEKPFLKLWDKKRDSIAQTFYNIEHKISKKLNIQE